MELLILFGLLTVVNLFFFLSRKGGYGRCRKGLLWLHVVSLLLLLFAIVLKINLGLSLRSGWSDRLIVVCALISGSSVFALYYRKLKLWAKLYFSVYFLYPFLATLAYAADGVFGVLVGAPLVFGLLIPQVSYRDANYELREWGGGLAPARVRLVKISTLTEKEIGRSYQEFSPWDRYEDLKIISVNADSTTALVIVNGRQEKIVFQK